MSVKNYYEILGLSQDASTSEILQAYWHKEDELRAQGLDTSDPQRVEIKTAYDTLSSVLKRREYDTQFNQPEPSTHSPALDEVRTELVDIIGIASSPPIIGGWQDAPAPADSIHNAPVMPDLRSSLHDDISILDDPFTDIAPPPKKSEPRKSAPRSTPSSRPKARKQQISDPFDWLNDPKSKSKQRTKASVTTQVQQQTSEKSSSSLVFIILAVLVLFGAIGFIFLAEVESETAVNTETNNQAVAVAQSTVTPSPTAAIRATSVPVATNTSANDGAISRLEARGDESFEAGEYSLAVTRYTQAISRGATPELYYKRALAFWTGREFMDDLEVLSAVNDLNNAIAGNANYAEAIRLRGVIYYELWDAFGIQDNRLQAITDLALYQAMAGQAIDDEVIDMLTALGQ